MPYKILALLLFPLYLLASPPSWFVNGNINAKSNEYIGYGSGKSKTEAKQNAKSDISNSIQSTIRSSLSINTQENNDEYSSNVRSNIESFSSIELSDTKVVKSEYIDDKWYIAIKYENLPFTKKVRKQFDSTTHLEKETNQYLVSTMLLKELKNEFGFYPKITIDKNMLLIGNKSFPISSSTLQKLFSSKISENIDLDIPKKVKHEEFYFIKITPKKKSYMTLVQIYENGESSILFDNKDVIKDKKIVFPNPDEYNGLEAYLNDGQIRSKDMTIAILCKTKKDFSYFDYMSTSKESYAKVYGKMFDAIDGCETSSKIMSITR